MNQPVEPLDLALHALHAQGEAPWTNKAAVRERVLGMIEVRVRRRRMVLRAATMVSVLLMGSTAWAAVTGRLPAVVQSMMEIVQPAARPAESAPHARKARLRRAEEPRTRAGAVAPQLPMNVPAQAPAQAEPTPVLATQLPRAHHGLTPVEAEQLYARGHRAYFVEHAYAQAAELWTQYLREAPTGRFSVDARYNRALAWMRLGRESPARRDLEMLARRFPTAYRQPEAAALLERLEERSGPTVAKTTSDFGQ